MSKVATMVFLALLLTAREASPNPLLMGQVGKLTAIKGLPFCALIYYEDKSDLRYDIRIIMDQGEITEDNLRLLFQAVSERYPAPVALDTQVDTDLRTPGATANGELVSIAGRAAAPSTEKTRSDGAQAKKVEAPHGAFYMRREAVELFRYNPNYPEHGMKTVILRGKE